MEITVYLEFMNRKEIRGDGSGEESKTDGGV